MGRRGVTGRSREKPGETGRPGAGREGRSLGETGRPGVGASGILASAFLREWGGEGASAV